MANKSLFASLKSRFTPADTRNEAGGRAYTLAPKHALAQPVAAHSSVVIFRPRLRSLDDE